jgi:hypothetical protein
VADQGLFPDVLRDMGIRQRPNYGYLGMTTTRPDGNSAVFAFSLIRMRLGPAK